MNDTISSRTPEGEPNRCPVCEATFSLEPSRPPGDAPCPHCGTLLWFILTSVGERVHESAAIAPIKIRLLKAIVQKLGVDMVGLLEATPLQDLRADSLDVVELVMDLEEEFDVAISDEDTEEIKTVGDAIDLIARLRARKEREEGLRFQPGERVRIRKGAFAGMTGVVKQILLDTHGLRIDVLIFGRLVPVEVTFHEVERTDERDSA